MEIDPDLCVGCELCLPYCPMDAISLENRFANIILERCVECGTCRRM